MSKTKGVSDTKKTSHYENPLMDALRKGLPTERPFKDSLALFFISVLDFIDKGVSYSAVCIAWLTLTFPPILFFGLLEANIQNINAQFIVVENYKYFVSNKTFSIVLGYLYLLSFPYVIDILMAKRDEEIHNLRNFLIGVVISLIFGTGFHFLWDTSILFWPIWTFYFLIVRHESHINKKNN